MKDYDRISNQLNELNDALDEVNGKTDQDDERVQAIKRCLECLRDEMELSPKEKTGNAFEELEKKLGWA